MRSGTIAFLVGITSFQLLSELPGFGGVVLLAILTVGMGLLSRSCSQCRYPLFICLGFGYVLLYVSLVMPAPLPSGIEGQDVIVEGVISSLPERAGRRVRFELLPDSIRLDGEVYPPPGRIRLNWYGESVPRLKAGERWRLTVRLKRAHGMSNPGGFDYERWLFQRGIRATGYIRHRGENVLLEDYPLSMPLQRVRQTLREHLSSALEDERASGLIVALAIGDRSGISDEQWRQLTESGTNHLMAISGLHVGMVAGIFYLLGGWLWRVHSHNLLWLPAPRVAAMSAILGAALYAALAGFSIPTQRALIMVTVAMGAILFGRGSQPSRVLALALLLVLLYDPLAVLSPGFWLSFLAVSVILYGVAGRLQRGGVFTQWGRVQLLVSLGLLPLLVLYFNQMAIAAPLANLIAIPWMSLVVVPITLLGTLLVTLLPAIGKFLLVTAATATDMLLTLIDILLGLLAPVTLATPSLWLLPPLFAGIVWLLSPRGVPARWLGGVLLLPLLLTSRDKLPEDVFRFTLFDVGQGLAAAIETREHVLIFDTGPRFSTGFDTGRAVIVPWLQSRGISTVDTLVVSHGDNDHIGGARSLIEHVPVRRVLTSVSDKMAWVENEPCYAGQRWQWDGIEFEMLHPGLHQSGRAVSENNGSCVLIIRGKGGAVLIPGDIEASAEYQLLSRDSDKLKATVLVAPHHGSKTSSTRRFVEAVAPQWVLFPVGYRNRYRFPNHNVLRRYQEAGSMTMESPASGAISFLFDAEQIEPEIVSYREMARRYWHN